MLHVSISKNDIPRCQDLQDVALCSLAQAMDTEKALAVDEVVETREVYESDHPVVCGINIALEIVNILLQDPRLASRGRY